MVIVRIGIPQIALLTMPEPAKGKDEDRPLLPQPSGSSSQQGAALDRRDRTAEAETSDSGPEHTQDEEHLVAQLQTYFQDSIRFLQLSLMTLRMGHPVFMGQTVVSSFPASSLHCRSGIKLLFCCSCKVHSA